MVGGGAAPATPPALAPSLWPFPPGALPPLLGAFLQVALVSGSVRALALCLPPLGGALGAPARAAAWVGSCPLAALQVTGPLAAALSARFGPRPVGVAGGALAGAGLALGAFGTRVEHLYLSLGGITGLGWSLSFTPALGSVSRWFPRHRPLATALAVSGAAVSGLALTPLTALTLDSYGWRGALLLLSAVSLHSIPAAVLLRPPESALEPPEPLERQRRRLLAPFRLLRRRFFLRYAASFALLDAGYYVPFVHCAGRTLELGHSGRSAALLVTVMSVLDGAGRLAAGWLAARPGAVLLRHLAFWEFLAGSVVLGWGFGKDFGVLAALAAAYGVCAGAVVPLQFAGAAAAVGGGREEEAVGVVQMVESVGSLLGAPLAGWLRDLTGDFTASFAAAAAFLLTSSLLILTLPPGTPPSPPPSRSGTALEPPE